MTADEGPSWAAASAASIREIFGTATRINFGKLALHDIALHFWMRAFGDSVASMRALSATLGTIAIPLVFLVALELLDDPGRASSISRQDGEAVAAVSALIFALNLIAIRLSREARMYPMMLVAALGHVFFFIRAARRGGVLNYSTAALFAVAAMAANFFAALLFCAEGLWVLYRMRIHYGLVITALTLSSASLPRLIPRRLLPAAYRQWYATFRPGTIYMMRRFFNAATWGLMFPLTTGLAAWGAIRGWRRVPEAVCFSLLWMGVPVLMLALFFRKAIVLLVVIGYAWTPIFIQRYLFACFPPFCILIALGIWLLGANLARVVALAIVVVLALGRIHAYQPTVDDLQWGVQWQEAAALIAPELKEGRPVNVRLYYSIHALRYYLRHETGTNPALLTRDDPRARLLVLSDQALALGNSNDIAAMRGAYPRVLARLNGVAILER